MSTSKIVAFSVEVEGGPLGQVQGPKPATDPTVGMICPVCGHPIEEGALSVVLPLGPLEPSDQRLCELSQPYRAIGVEVHAICAGHFGGRWKV